MLPLDLYARVRIFFAHCTRDRGCSAHPVFPAPFPWKGREVFGKTRARRAARLRRCAFRLGNTDGHLAWGILRGLRESPSSFRGATKCEPGIHNPDSWLWIP